MTTTSTNVQLFTNPIFNNIMCRDTRILRDEVYDLVGQYAYTNDVVGLEKACVQTYSPVAWELSSLYASHGEIYEAILRKTSAKFYTSEGDEKVRGVLKGARHKDVDWLSVLRCDPVWWYAAVKFPRETPFMPQSMSGDMAIDFQRTYTAFTKWLMSDFSYTTLRKILELSTKYASVEITRCMGMVDDYSKRSIKYLTDIIENEQAINAALLRDQQTLHESS